ncbi:MAG: dipeptidase PepE [Rikenellaceae bacterium]
MNLLLISNSTNAGEAYLDYPKNQIKDFLSKRGVKKVLFVPFAAVTFSFDEYLLKVAERFTEIGIEVESVHNAENMVKAVLEAEAVVVGGGNTFQLVQMMQMSGIMDAIAYRVKEDSLAYVGWSAGSNVTCPTLSTTNDMPIVEPLSFNTMNIIPFQINPHYTDFHPKGHAGETRDQRLAEYLAANKQTTVVGLREGCMLLVEDATIKLIGDGSLRVFKYGSETTDYTSSDSLDFLLALNG